MGYCFSLVGVWRGVVASALTVRARDPVYKYKKHNGHRFTPERDERYDRHRKPGAAHRADAQIQEANGCDSDIHF